MITPPEIRRAKGFAIVSALFILVALAALGAFIAVVSGAQQIGSVLDVDGARAYYAARSGAEWGAARAFNASACAGATNLGPVNQMTVTVNCAVTATGNGVEAGLGTLWTITSTACNQPAAVGGSCPGAAGGANYVERRVTVLVER